MNENEIIIISSDEESTTSEPVRKKNAGADESSSTIVKTCNRNVNINSLNVQENSNSCNIQHKIGNLHFNITVSNSTFEGLKNSKITKLQPLKVREFGTEYRKDDIPTEQEPKKIRSETYSKRELCESNNANNLINIVDESEPIENNNLNYDKVSKENSESAVASSSKKQVKIFPVESHNSKIYENNKALPCCSKSLQSNLEINKKVNELITTECNQADLPAHLQENLKVNEDEKYEMSSLFKEFMNVVLSVEKNESDKAKLQSKITKYHNLADSNFLKSPKFQEILVKSIAKTKINPSAAYFIIKEVLDILLTKRTIKKKLEQKKMSCKDNSQCKGDKDPEDDIYFDGNDVNHRLVKKLTKRLELLGNRIKELEEEEVDFEEEDNSNYLKMQRYRERFCQIYVKLCKYTNKNSDANRVYCRKIHYSGTKFSELNINIEKWLNTIKIFPDFSDVLKFTEEQNSALSLKLSKEQIQTLAVDIFSDIGNMLQRLRRQDLWDSFSSYLGNDIDPALKDTELSNELRKSYKLGLQKERELINYYAEKQDKEHLQPIEVPDEVADLSPESSEEEDKEIGETEKTSSNFDESEIVSKVESTTKDDILISESKNSESTIEHNEIDVEKPNTNEINDVAISSVKPEVSSTTVMNSDSSKNKSYLVSLSLNNVIALLNNVKSDNNILNEEDTLNYAKRFKFSNKTDDDSESDCEVTEIVSVNKNGEREKKNLNIEKRRLHHINYAFINKCFSHNTFLYGEDLSKKKSNYWFNFRIEKISGSFPFADLTNSKNASDINLSFSGIEAKRKGMIHTIKSRYFNRRRRYDFKMSNFDKMNNQCAPQKGTKKRKTNDSIQSETKNEHNNSKKNSSDQTDKLPSKEGFSGGNGQDNSDHNENIKPFDRDCIEIAKNEQDVKEEDDGEQESNKSITVIDDGVKDESSKSQKVADNGPYKNTESEELKLSDDSLYCKPSHSLSPNRKSELKSLYNFLNIDFENDNFSLLPEIKALLESTLIDGTQPNAIREAIEMQESTQKNEVVMKDMRQESRADVNKEPIIVDADIPISEIKDGNSEELRKEPSKQETLRNISNKDIEIISDYEKCSKAMKRKFPESARECDEELSDNAAKKQAKSKGRAISDDELIKNFLKNSPSSLSIKKPRRKQDTTSKIVEALATLRRLKSISTTVVKTSAKAKNEEDVVIIGESLNNKTVKPSDDSSLSSSSKEKKENIIIPKIVTVQGNVADFEKISNESINYIPFGYNAKPNEKTHAEPWQVQTSNVHDNFQRDFMENFDTPMKNNHQHSRFRIIKYVGNKEEIEKNVEYVVLD